MMCSDIEENGLQSTVEMHGVKNADTVRIFLWDNLNSHLAPIVGQTIHEHTVGPGPVIFSSCPRPPYQPKYGPIEYVICQVTSKAAKEVQANWTTQDLEQAIRRAAVDVGPFDSTFEHCGY